MTCEDLYLWGTETAVSMTSESYLWGSASSSEVTLTDVLLVGYLYVIMFICPKSRFLAVLMYCRIPLCCATIDYICQLQYRRSRLIAFDGK